MHRYGGETMQEQEELYCPKCNKEMAFGFSSKAKALSFVAPYDFAKPTTTKIEVGPISFLERFGISTRWYPAYLCKSCSIQVVSYGNTISRIEAREIARKITNT